MDQAHSRGHERARLLNAAAPLLQAVPGDIWLVHQVIPLADGKIDKPPAPGFRTNDAASWCSLADAIEEALRYPPGTAGVGFTIPAGMISFDFDACIHPNGTTEPEIAALIERLDSFSYRTVSGRGMRVICRNKVDNGVRPGKYTHRTEGGQKVEVFVGPCNFYNTFSATGANGHRIECRATLTRVLLHEWLGTGGAGNAGISTSGNLGEIGRTSDLGKRARDQDALLDALKAIPNEGAIDRHQWMRIGQAVYAGTEGSERGREAFIAWSESWVDYLPKDAENTIKLWDSFHSSPPRTIGAGTVFRLAHEHGWKWPEERAALDKDTEDETNSDETLPPPLSEAALARCFAERHRGWLRHVAAWGWYCWTGSVWRQDETQLVLNEARKLCQAAAREARTAVQARTLVKVSTAKATLAYAAAIRALAATVEQWDIAGDRLNTPDAALDLATKARTNLVTWSLRPHRAQDYMTKISAVTPERNQPCPRWLRFLDEITGGDQELIDYLQRVCGYCLTGSIAEHTLFFAHGSGANGKSTFVNLLTWIMGNYAAVAPMETFMVRHGEAHPTELARLRGVRLVVAQEIEEGRSWAESRIKALTGGDPVTARFMRQDFFTYQPQFKLFIAGNHKPRLRNVDVATRRRFHLIPFTVQTPKERQNKNLPEELKAEGPGILAWMADGNTAWVERGLDPPQAVLDATDDYLNTEDALGNWLTECCETGLGLSEGSQRLYASYEAWMRRAGEHTPSLRRFVQALTSRGFAKQIRTDHSKPSAIDGLRLRGTGLQDGL